MLDLRVIGELRLSGATAELPASRRARGLLGWLAIHPGAHHRSRLAGLFWPDVLEASARASLRSAMWALRPALGSCLIASRDAVSLGGEIRVDLRDFRRLIADGQLAAALGLTDGDLLQEMDDDWVLGARDEFDRDVAAALAELTAQAARSGDTDGALSWARRWAGLCPLDETAGAALIRAHIDAGDGSAAVEAFGRLRQRLGAELGVPVSAATEALVAPLRGMSGATAPWWPGQAAATPVGLVGRDRQFGELMAGWRAARAGTGTVILLAGEGGIGKTRLVLELQARAGATAVRAGPVVAAPFVLWTEALSELVAVTGRPDEPWTADLARIVPALGQPGPAVSDPHLERVRLCEAVVQFLGWAARRGPLLVAFEDVHLADGASLDLIAYAGRRLGRMPVLFVLTRRLLPVRQQLDGVLSALRSHGALAAELALGPLPGDAVRELIRSAAPDLAAPVIRQITELAGGSPLLAIETARAAAGRAADIPAGLAGVVRQAMGSLSVPARMCAEFAAVAGRDLDRAEVAALPLPSPARDVAEALGSGLLTDADGRLGFRHTLLRDAAYQALAEPVRARLHGELARLLRKRGGQRAAEIAHHLLLAGQDEAAVAHLTLAARDARRVAAMAAASGFLGEALRVEPDDPEMLVELAEVEAFRGLPAASDQAFDRALALIAPADSGALISAWLRRGRWLRGGICHPRESRRSYQSALDVLDRDPDAPARAEALAGLAWAEAVAGDPGGVNALLAEADRILGSNPSDLLVHDIGVARGHALIRAGQFTASFGPLIAASTAAGRAGRPDMAYTCLSNAASAAACAGDFTRALDFADRCLPLVTPNGLLRLSVYAQVARSAILRRLDRHGEARRACEAAAGYAGRIGLPELDGLVRAERGLLALACRDATTAVAELSAALEHGAPVSRPATRLRLAEALALAVKPGEAEAELRNVVLEPVGPADFPATLVARMSRVQGLIASARGDLPDAERRLTESMTAWRRIAGSADGRQAGAGYVASLIDLGRPPVSSLVEPAAELALVTAELATLRGR